MISSSDFVISRVFDVPREVMFRTWVDPKHMAQWWGPSCFTNLICEIDLRPGGVFRIVMRSPDGVDYPIGGEFREVVEPERLLYVMDLAEHPEEWRKLVNTERQHPDGRPVLAPVSTALFEDLDGRTRLTVIVQFESATVRDAMLNMGLAEGWSQSFDNSKRTWTRRWHGWLER